MEVTLEGDGLSEVFVLSVDGADVKLNIGENILNDIQSCANLDCILYPLKWSYEAFQQIMLKFWEKNFFHMGLV